MQIQVTFILFLLVRIHICCHYTFTLQLWDVDFIWKWFWWFEITVCLLLVALVCPFYGTLCLLSVYIVGFSPLMHISVCCQLHQYFNLIWWWFSSNTAVSQFDLEMPKTFFWKKGFFFFENEEEVEDFAYIIFLYVWHFGEKPIWHLFSIYLSLKKWINLL